MFFFVFCFGPVLFALRLLRFMVFEGFPFVGLKDSLGL